MKYMFLNKCALNNIEILFSLGAGDTQHPDIIKTWFFIICYKDKYKRGKCFFQNLERNGRKNYFLLNYMFAWLKFVINLISICKYKKVYYIK